MNKLVLKLLFIVSFTNVIAQNEFGGHPSHQDWRRLNSPSVRVIYPIGMDSSAQRIASLINYMAINNLRSVGGKSKKLSIVLHSQTVTSNAYVAIAPFRSEFFSTPPESNALVGSLDWLDVLAVHEYRHALQMSNTRVGLTNVLYVLGGENFWAAANGFIIPSWYFEGDAVITETALTNAGRGRTAFFTKEQRALASGNINFSYAKNRNGSFKSIVPDQYRLGYMMLSSAREKSGNAVGASVLGDAARFKYLFYTFSKSLRNNVGLTSTGLYKYAWNNFKITSANNLSPVKLLPTNTITEGNRRTPSNYSFPKKMEDGSVLARKSSFKETASVVKIKDGEETFVCSIGYSQDDYLALQNNQLAWTELTKNPRRGYQTFSNIVTYDMNSGTKKRLTHKTRYFSPSFSPDASKIATIHIALDQSQHIHILDAQTGDVLQEIENPDKFVFSRTAWTSDGTAIVTIAKKAGMLQLIKINIADASSIALCPKTAHILDNPIVDGEWVYFNADFSGIDNIYAANLDASQDLFQISSVPVGAYEPSVFGNDLYFTEYTTNGHMLATQTFDLFQNKEGNKIQFLEPKEMPQFKIEAAEAEGGNILGKTGNELYPSIKHQGFLRSMKLHSWNYNILSPKKGVRVEMVNLMNDIKVNTGVSQNKNENYFKSYNADLTIGRYYPEITLHAAQSKRAADFYSSADTLAELNFDETSFGLDLGVPLSYLRGNYATSFYPKVGFNMYNMSNLQAEGRYYLNDNISAIDYGFKFSLLKRTAYQNLGTRLGLSVDLKMNATIDGSDANKTFFNTHVYLPGIGKNDYIDISGGYQKEPLKNKYQFEDVFVYTRGFMMPINDEIKSLSFNYNFPLCYPDFGIAGITYFKRIRANVFYDYAEVNKKENITVLKSGGLELIFDNNYFNLAPISVGFRTAIVSLPGFLGNTPALSLGVFAQIGF